MVTSTLLGALIVALAGLSMGTGAWTLKALRRLQIEHWLFVAMLVGLILVPWLITLLAFPGALAVYREVEPRTLLLANLFALGWGIANVLCGLCFVRIGVALTGGILGGLGLSLGVLIPMIFKASGLFNRTASPGSPAGLTILAGVGVMLAGVVLVSFAGFGRDRLTSRGPTTSGSFLGGFIMAITAGILSAGPNFVFAYSQDPIVSRVCVIKPGQEITVQIGADPRRKETLSVEDDGSIHLASIGRVEIGGMRLLEARRELAEKAQAANFLTDSAVLLDTHSLLATFPVWSIGMLGGAAVNLLFPLYLMWKNRSFHLFRESLLETVLPAIGGLQFCAAIILLGVGSLQLGALGASVGWGIYQATQIVGGQAVGFLSGEWRGIHGTPRHLMFAAIAALLAGAVLVAFGNTRPST